ncbi:MAG: septal ring lytic transglycosylase RlpA family protein, partial [Alphaproteobacteria bacterium]|nr:septal ring lytic transglycosylase RlpA family protein [Alphaproteobacteria bacterium]
MTRQEPPPRPEPPPSQAAVPPVKPGGIYKVGNPYQVAGIWYTPKEDPGYDETGIASWYGHPFHGKVTANGETYDMNDMTAAHKTLPMPVMVRVTNLENGRQLVLRVNDRGPFVHGRIIDVSRRGAQLLGFEGKGTARVRVQVIAPVFDGPGPQFVPPVETAPEERLAVAAPREVVTAESLPPAPGTQVAGPLPPRPAAREPDPPPRNAARSP